MRRREFIGLLGGAAGWPLVARAQARAVPVIGYLNSGSPDSSSHLVTAFRRGLSDNGYFEGQNLAIEYRWARGRYEQLPALAAELVRYPVTLIAAFTPPAALAAKAATSATPIVFMSGTDPVKLGLVASLNRPEGNVTGATFFSTGLEPKWLELLHELVPAASTLAVLVNPKFPERESQLRDIAAAARTIGQRVVILEADSESSIESVFAGTAEKGVRALLVASDPFFFSRRHQLVALAARHKVSAIYQLREFVDAGGLMSYGTSVADACQQAGVYSTRILKGDKAADLPVIQPTRFEMVINLKTAKALGLEIPPTLLARADEVIE